MLTSKFDSGQGTSLRCCAASAWQAIKRPSSEDRPWHAHDEFAIIFVMTKEQVKEILDRVLTWPQADQEKVARFARQVEHARDGDDISEEEWRIIEERAARRDLASDEEVESVFSRYRNA